jgi:hypothetical protein
MTKEQIIKKTKQATITALAKHLGKSRVGLYKMQRSNPRAFVMLWNDWLKQCEIKDE